MTAPTGPHGLLAKITDPTWLVAHGTAAVFLIIAALTGIDPTWASKAEQYKGTVIAVFPIVALLILAGYYAFEFARGKITVAQLGDDLVDEWPAAKADIADVKTTAATVPGLSATVADVTGRTAALEARVARAEAIFAAQPAADALVTQAKDAAIAELEGRLAGATRKAPAAKTATKPAAATTKAATSA